MVAITRIKETKRLLFQKYIPQCFLIDGSSCKWRNCSSPFFNAGGKRIFLVYLFYFLIHIFLFLAVNCPQRLAFFPSSSSWKHPVMADGAFRLWFRGGVGCWVMWREEMDSRPWAFPLVYSHWFTESTERKEAKNAVFLQTLSWWRWRQSGRVFAALHGVFFPPQKCCECLPEDFPVFGL